MLELDLISCKQACVTLFRIFWVFRVATSTAEVNFRHQGDYLRNHLCAIKCIRVGDNSLVQWMNQGLQEVWEGGTFQMERTDIGAESFTWTTVQCPTFSVWTFGISIFLKYIYTDLFSYSQIWVDPLCTFSIYPENLRYYWPCYDEFHTKFLFFPANSI